MLISIMFFFFAWALFAAAAQAAIIVDGFDFIDTAHMPHVNLTAINYLHGEPWRPTWSWYNFVYTSAMHEFKKCPHHVDLTVASSKNLLAVATQLNAMRTPGAQKVRQNNNAVGLPLPPVCIYSLDDLLVAGDIALSAREWAGIHGVVPLQPNDGPRGPTCAGRVSVWEQLVPPPWDYVRYGQYSNIAGVAAIVDFARNPVFCTELHEKCVSSQCVLPNSV